MHNKIVLFPSFAPVHVLMPFSHLFYSVSQRPGCPYSKSHQESLLQIIHHWGGHTSSARTTLTVSFADVTSNVMCMKCLNKLSPTFDSISHESNCVKHFNEIFLFLFMFLFQSSMYTISIF